MKPEAQKVVDDAASRRVPAEMLDRLKNADDRLAAAKAELDASVVDTAVGHAATVDAAHARLREAEQVVEKASGEVGDKLKKASGQ